MASCVEDMLYLWKLLTSTFLTCFCVFLFVFLFVFDAQHWLFFALHQQVQKFSTCQLSSCPHLSIQQLPAIAFGPKGPGSQGPITKPLTLTLDLMFMLLVCPKPHELYCGAQGPWGLSLNP